MEIIAEIGQNHNGEMSLAKELIHAAKEAGANAAKFQLYDAAALFPPKSENEWFDYNMKTELSRNQLHLLNEECEKVGIEFMSSVFDSERVDWLEEIGAKRYKIASRSIHEKELIDKLVQTGKPLIASLGWWKEEGLPKIESKIPVEYLYCVSKYPTEFEDLEFSKIDFENTYAGFSDHTIGVEASYIACARGAKILEKHFTLDKTMYGPDHACSMTPDELKSISKFVEIYKKSL